jgi:AcrR family transcriptional regulator
MAEIKQTARRILVAEGPDAVTLRAIAREMGMTAPALYRYFGSHEELVKHVIADIFTELAGDIRAAITAADAGSGGDMTAKVLAACWEFRRWSLGHPREFGLIFGTPLPGLHVEQDEITAEGGGQFGNTFFVLMIELYRKQPFPVPPDDEIDPGLAEQLERYRDGLGQLAAGLPIGLLLVFLRCWVRLYGIAGPNSAVKIAGRLA